MATPFQVAARRNAIRRGGRAFLEKLSLATSIDLTTMQMLSAEESFEHAERRRRQLLNDEGVLRRAQTWGTLRTVADRLAKRVGLTDVVVSFGSFKDFHVTTRAGAALAALHAMGTIDHNVVTITASDLTGELDLDIVQDDAVDMVVRGEWIGMGAPLPEPVAWSSAKSPTCLLTPMGDRLVVPIGTQILQPGDDRWRDHALRYDVQVVGRAIEATFMGPRSSRPLVRFDAASASSYGVDPHRFAFGLDVTEEAMTLGWPEYCDVDVAADETSSVIAVRRAEGEPS
jgi:hypothetical protein